MPRFYDVTDGEVFVDGIDVREYRQDALHNKIGYVSQRATILKGTVKSNIVFGKGNNKRITNEEVNNALKVAQAYDFVSQMDNTLNGCDFHVVCLTDPGFELKGKTV